jgi:hypothetical protein
MLINRAKAAALCLATLATGAGVSYADEEMVPLAISGEWVAAAHHPSQIAPPDVCMAFDIKSAVAFRASDDGTEFRVSDNKWSLPPRAEGDILISIGTLSTVLHIDWNDATMVSAPVAFPALIPMFDAMDKAPSMSVTVGKAKPLLVSLVGSTRATNAFRTCAGINSNAASPGSNPFE